MEVPIAHDLESGYSIPKTYSIPPLMFNDREISVIRVGLSFIESQSNRDMKEAAKSVALKIENVLPSALKPLYTTMENSVIVDPIRNRSEHTESDGEWYRISGAISNNNSILFNYKKGSERRVVDPYLLVYFGDHWNLIGFDKSRAGFRNFRLEFMSELEVTDSVYDRSEGLGPMHLFKGMDDVTKQIEVVLKVREEIWNEFYRTIPAEISDVKKTKGEYSVSLKFDSLENLDRILMRYADDVIPLSPNTLIDIRRARLSRMLGDIN
jgi:predicted DNA-binding transcriptional regulator YafY